jgi:two-component system OmpR family response regulator
MHLLVIEDDPEQARWLTRGLEQAGHRAAHVADGIAGLEAAITGDFDAVVLDRGLPRLEGLGLLEALRRERPETPVLIVSSRTSVEARVEGLRAGGDDYLVKPFALSELLARLEAVLRRSGSEAAAEPVRIDVEDLAIDLLAMRVTRADRVIALQPREYQLLCALARQAGRVVSRTHLLEAVWNYRFDPSTNVIDVHVHRLRRKIDDGAAAPLIHTVRGVGYRLGAADPTHAPEKEDISP